MKRRDGKTKGITVCVTKPNECEGDGGSKNVNENDMEAESVYQISTSFPKGTAEPCCMHHVHYWDLLLYEERTEKNNPLNITSLSERRRPHIIPNKTSMLELVLMNHTSCSSTCLPIHNTFVNYDSFVICLRHVTRICRRM